jgi:hypothetical protein
MICLRSRRIAVPLLIIVFQSISVAAAPKPHIISFGKPLALKIRPLSVDARVKEFTLGPAHDVTDRLFVVRRAFRVNDSLPQESTTPPRWQWQRGGGLLVDRITGHTSAINLPEFDALYSAVSWYCDYAAYCGVSTTARKSTPSSRNSTAASRF